MKLESARPGFAGMNIPDKAAGQLKLILADGAVMVPHGSCAHAHHVCSSWFSSAAEKI